MADTVETIYKAKGNHHDFLKKTVALQKGLVKNMVKASKTVDLLGFTSTRAFSAIAASAAISAVAIASTVKEFSKLEKALSGAKAILRPTAKEFEALTEASRELGRTTAFTASQAAEAFTELGKLGFSTSEILEATTDVLSLASAANSDLATAASVTAKTLNQFSLEAEEAGRVTDVIAEASASSAIDIFNFSEAMKFAGTTAAGFGVELEDAAGALSALADAGLEGSIAGTGFSRAMIEMNRTGSKANDMLVSLGVENGTLTERLIALQNAGLDTSEIIDSFGVIAGKSALALINNADRVKDLADKYRDASGAAKEMADIQLDNLDGSIKILKSAFSDLKIEIGEAFGPETKNTVDTFTELINKAAQGISDYKKGLRIEELEDQKEFLKTDKFFAEQAAQEISRLEKQIEKERSDTKKKNLIEERDLAIKNLTRLQGERLARLKHIQSETKAIFGDPEKQAKDAADAALKAAEEKAKAEKDAEEKAEAERIIREKKRTSEEKAEAEKKYKELLKLRKVAYLEIELFGLDQFAKEEAETKRHFEELLSLYQGGGESLASTRLAIEEELDRRLDAIRLKRLKKEAEGFDIQGPQLPTFMEADSPLTKEILDTTEMRQLTMLESYQEFWNQYGAIADMGISTINSAFSTMSSKRMSEIDEEMRARIEAVEATSKSEKRKQQEIEKIEQEARKLKHDQALADWRRSIAMIQVDTAAGIAKTWATVGYPAAIPLTIAMGAQSTIQTGVALANKPRFRTGSVDASGQPRIIGQGVGTSGGIDSQLGLFSPGELIVPPQDAPAVRDFMRSGGLNTTQTVKIDAPITIQGNASEEALAQIPTLIEEGVARAIENQQYTNLFNPNLI